jgi:hypothetical protein
MKGNTRYKENEQKRRKSRSRRGNFQKTFKNSGYGGSRGAMPP